MGSVGVCLAYQNHYLWRTSWCWCFFWFRLSGSFARFVLLDTALVSWHHDVLEYLMLFWARQLIPTPRACLYLSVLSALSVS